MRVMPKNLPGQTPKRLMGNGSTPKPPPRRWRMRDKMPWLPYVLPLALFILLTGLEDTFKAIYPFFYTVKIAAVTALVVLLWRFLPELRPQRNGVGLAAALGVLLTFIWVIGDQATPHFKFLGSRIGYDPFQEIPNAAIRVLFLIVRFFGLVVVVPIVEEVFYRGFLLRYVTDPDDFRRVPLGRFSMVAFLFNIVFMAASHPEWLVAGIFSAAMCALIARTRKLFACIVAHGVTNLLLGVYVLHFHQWQYW